MKHFLRNTFLLIFILTLPFLTFGQKKVRLSNMRSGNSILLKEGKRVEYILKDKIESTVGILDSVQNDSLIIDGYKFNIQDLEAIGKKKKGTGFWVTTLTIFSAGWIISAITPDPDPCPNCQNVSDTNAASSVGVFVIGVGFGALAYSIASNNSPKNINNEVWLLEIIN